MFNQSEGRIRQLPLVATDVGERISVSTRDPIRTEIHLVAIKPQPAHAGSYLGSLCITQILLCGSLNSPTGGLNLQE